MPTTRRRENVPGLGANLRPRVTREKYELGPAYQRVSTRFMAEIEAGRLKPHTQLPSERDVSEMFRIGRMTARHAFEHLEREGVVYRKARDGWYVSPPRLEYHLDRDISRSNSSHTCGCSWRRGSRAAQSRPGRAARAAPGRWPCPPWSGRCGPYMMAM